MLEQPVRARLDRDGHQVVDVTVRAGYHPAAIVARAGLPLRLVFRRDDDDACSERVVFSAPRLDRRLTPTGTTTIDLPAQPLGEIRFTCGMGRYRGHIVLVDDRPPSMVARLRDQASRLETALGTAFVLWICSLPLIAVLAVLVLDATAAIAAAGAALIAWVAGCLWAFGRSAEPT
jgi:plastocyanin domain-containing protein